MDIDVKSLPAGKLLSEVKPGTCFMRGSDIYIKTDEIDPDGDIQVVNLKDGSLHRYPSNNEVFIIKVRLTDDSNNISKRPIFGGMSYIDDQSPSISVTTPLSDNGVQFDDSAVNLPYIPK